MLYLNSKGVIDVNYNEKKFGNKELEFAISEYEILHTQSKDYIINDIIEVMKERGLEI